MAKVAAKAPAKAPAKTGNKGVTGTKAHIDRLMARCGAENPARGLHVWGFYDENTGSRQDSSMVGFEARLKYVRPMTSALTKVEVKLGE